ncbi:MAG: peptidylprolyl isomerase [Bacteroidetes bacterium]|nr:peptidylprolyl isomerase [Bacteroidota bacterium]
MKKFLSFVPALMLCMTLAYAQSTNYNPNATLFTLSDEKVTAGDFVKVYQKTNVSGEADFSEQSLRDYLDLYVNFRLKVKEARDMKMDTTAAVLNEFKTYRSKLTPSYMFDTSLIRVAYDRMQKELHVQHILIKLDPLASPADTLKALNKAKAWRKMLTDKTKKVDFNQFAADSSNDPSAKDNRGDLGWITTMQLIYPFETAAYNLKPGEISQPVRTQFGYHLIRVVESRPAQGTVTAAHLFIKVGPKATEEDQNEAKRKIDSLYALLRSGANWDDLVKANSQDKTTSANGGQLKPFTTGQMVSEFEQTAFNLQKPGDISAPVKTKFGWHIIKLIEKKPLGSYADVKDDIKKKIENGPWKDYAKQSFINKRKAEYAFKEFPAAKQALFAQIDSSLLKGIWNDSMVVKAKMNAAVFSLNDAKWVPETKNFTQADLADYIQKNQRKYMASKMTQAAILNTLYDQFVGASVTSFEDARLEAKYPAFKDLMDEYMNGILLFDLASDKVWTKAVEDTVGLKAFYEENKEEYMGQEKARVTTYTAKNQSVVDQFNKYKSKKMSDADILAKINKKDTSLLKISTADFEKGKSSEIETLGWGTAGTSYTVKSDSSIRILTINEILPPAPKPLNEVKGYVVADYQEKLEDDWIDDLKKKYPVSVNEPVLLSLVKK